MPIGLSPSDSGNRWTLCFRCLIGIGSLWKRNEFWSTICSACDWLTKYTGEKASGRGSAQRIIILRQKGMIAILFFMHCETNRKESIIPSWPFTLPQQVGRNGASSNHDHSRNLNKWDKREHHPIMTIDSTAHCLSSRLTRLAGACSVSRNERRVTFASHRLSWGHDWLNTEQYFVSHEIE